MANASVIAALGGVSLTSNMVNPMLNRLLSLGLLNADFACVESLRHSLAIEMIAASEGGKAAEAVRRIFPAALNRSAYYSYSPQSDPGARVRLRLAIYEKTMMRWNGRPSPLAFASIRSKTSVGNRK